LKQKLYQIIATMENTEMLIVGAGPAGSALACFLGYHGTVPENNAMENEKPSGEIGQRIGID